MGSKTPFSLRFEPELLKEVRAVSIQVGLPVTKIIELAVQEYMPVLRDHIRQEGKRA